MRNLDPELLRTFLAVAEAPSFAEAGERVNKTQSTVSVQMRRLEETVGVALFEKKGRRNVLSAPGRELLDYAARIVRLNDEAVARFTAPRISGRLRIGTPDDYAETFLPEIFGRFATSHPTVEVAIECRTSDELVALVEEGRLDLAIVTMNAHYRAARVLLQEDLVWVSSPDRMVERQRPLPVAVWQPGCAWRTQALEALDGAGVDYRIAYTGTSGVALALTVRAGLAVAAIPRRFPAHGLRPVPASAGLPAMGPFEIGMVRSERADGALAGAFVAHAEACMAALGQAGRPVDPGAAPAVAGAA